MKSFLFVLTLSALGFSTAASAMNAEAVVICTSFKNEEKVRVRVVRFIGSGLQMSVEANGTSYTWPGVKRKKLAQRYTYQRPELGLLELHRGDNERSESAEALYAVYTSYDDRVPSVPMNCAEGKDVEDSLSNDR